MTTASKTVRALFDGLGATISGPDVPVALLAYDSRKVIAGACFASLPGARVDGHAFIDAALAAGATSIVCERDVEVGGATRVLVQDARRALAIAAKRFFDDPSRSLCLVGVTGTNGKTTTTHIIEAVLRSSGRAPAVIGTLGYRYGSVHSATGLTTPESLELVRLLADMRAAGVDAVTMEVSSHALVQHRVSGVDYDVTVFTNLTHDHLDYHRTMEAYFAAKALLFQKRRKPNGIGVVNFDDSFAQRLLGKDVLSFSAEGAPAADVRVVRMNLAGFGTELLLATPRGPLELRSPLVGRFNVENILAAVTVGEALGLAHDAVARGIASCNAVPGRLEKVSTRSQPLVVVDYAHTPDALEKALQVMREVTKGRLLCVFGCGGDRDPNKRPVMGEVARRSADYTIVTSDNPRSEDPRAIVDAICRGFAGSHGAFEVELDRAAAIRRAVAMLSETDALLIAGKGHETYQIIGLETRHFDDREEARHALASVTTAPRPREENERGAQ